MSVKRRTNQIPMHINRINYGSQSKPQKSIYEGPKYQCIGKDKPKPGNPKRRTLLPSRQKVQKKQKIEKKAIYHLEDTESK